MFTGLIEDVGSITKLESRGNYSILSIKSKLASQNLKLGESIACDGVCLTVVAFDNQTFEVEASQETKAVTNIDNYKVGTFLNLERAMKLGDRLGGHMVSGHTDTCGEIAMIKNIGDSVEITISYDKKFDNLLIKKGSVAISGISLTVNDVESGKFKVNIIPHTLKKTTISNWQRGDRVNLEFDLIGKYILNMNNKKPDGLTIDKLLESGW